MTTPLAIDLSLLPPGARRIVECVGVPAAMRLLRKLGGTRVRLLRGTEPPRALLDALDRHAAEALCAMWTGERSERDEAPVVLIPKADKLLSQLRDMQVLAALDAGQTTAQVALQFDLTERWVEMIRAGRSRKRPLQRQIVDVQGDLFG